MARRVRCCNRDCPAVKAGAVKAAKGRKTCDMPRADAEGGGKRDLTSEEVRSLRNGQLSGIQKSVVKNLLHGGSGFNITDKK